MRVQLRHATLAAIFSLWVLLRFFPLAAFPGLYSLDAWIHLGYCLGIAQYNRIPTVDPIEFPYYHMPLLHLFTLLLHHLLGLQLMVSLKMATAFFSAASFLSFYLLFRALLAKEWQIQTSMLVLALSADVTAQMNAPIPEAAGLFLLPLALHALLRVNRRFPVSGQRVIVLTLLIAVLVLTHHLATLFFILACLALLAGQLLARRKGESFHPILITLYALGLSLGLIPVTNPFVVREVALHLLWVAFFISACCAFFLLLAGAQKKFHAILVWVSRLLSSIRAPIVGAIIGSIFLLLAVTLYPYARPVLWRLLKFGLPAMLLSLSISVTPFLSERARSSLLEAFTISWFTLLILTFTGSTLLSLLSSPTTLTLESVLASRHLTYLITVSTIIAVIGLEYWLLSAPGLPFKAGKYRLGVTATIVGLFGLLLVGGAANLYAPVGGWHKSWCSTSEIQGGVWLVTNRGNQSITATDARLGTLLQGLAPLLPSNHSIVLLTEEQLTTPLLLSNATGKNGFFFVSERMEREFMVNFVIPPFALSCHDALDQHCCIPRIYDSTTVTIYITQPS